jgi:hypothetical protein
MANRIPADIDLALRFWARLFIIEQLSLAIIDRSFPQAGQARGTRRRNALLAAEANPSLAAKPANRKHLSPQTADEFRQSAPVSKSPFK